jgi:Spy/CpxP family protein refolding chaperone
MKKFFPYLVAAAIAAPFVAAGAMAQPNAPTAQQGPRGERGHHGRGHGDPSQHAEHRARMLTAILDLDAHQSQEVRRILARAATEMQALMSRPRGEERHTAMRALHDRTKTEIDALLTPAQRATMDRMEAARREGHGGREGHRGPARRN